LMPDVQFYFLGGMPNTIVPYIIRPYQNLPNVHLLGHQAGDLKVELLRRCKILINTSIHDAIPVSFLEALSYGTLIVSCQNPDAITERYGAYTGTVLGDGRDKAPVFAEAIRMLLNQDERRVSLSVDGRSYVQREHALAPWVEAMR